MDQGFIHKYVSSPIISLLRQGLSPKMLALSMSFGITVGLFPIVGTTTAICTMAAIMLRMNLLVMQLGNWLVYPVQILLVVPFIILGGHLFNTIATLDPTAIMELLRTDLWAAVRLFSKALVHATIAWFLCAPFVFTGFYMALLFVFRQLHSRMQRGTAR